MSNDDTIYLMGSIVLPEARFLFQNKSQFNDQSNNDSAKYVEVFDLPIDTKIGLGF